MQPGAPAGGTVLRRHYAGSYPLNVTSYHAAAPPLCPLPPSAPALPFLPCYLPTKYRRVAKAGVRRRGVGVAEEQRAVNHNLPAFRARCAGADALGVARAWTGGREPPV